jgi:hypothetical protein
MSKQSVAHKTGRTVFLKTVRSAPVKPFISKFGVPLRALKWAGKNVKIGGLMTKGHWAGMPIYALTLEERKTCPSTCQQWNKCYGDNMYLAARHKADRNLTRALTADLKALDSKFPNGYVVRLHVLGDFYSSDYVMFWQEMLDLHPALRIYGYTHWQMGTLVGDAVTRLAVGNPTRVSILRSDCADVAHDPLAAAMVIPAGSTEPAPGTKVICPNETGKVNSCGECGLCMLGLGKVGISFLNHSHAETLKKSLAARGLPVLETV